MSSRPYHQHRRCASDSVPDKPAVSAGTSPGTDSVSAAEEFVEVTLDLQDDDTIVLRSVEPATVINIDDAAASASASASVGPETPASVSRSPSTIRRSSSNRLRQFSQELKAEAVAKARHFSQELRAELKRFSWSHGHASRVLSASSSSTAAVAGSQNGGSGGGFDSALAARALRRQRAQLDRTRSGAQKALRGLRFISNKTNGVDAWNEVQSNFDKLARDGLLCRADFAQCIGDDPFRLLLNAFFECLLGNNKKRKTQTEPFLQRDYYQYHNFFLLF